MLRRSLYILVFYFLILSSLLAYEGLRLAHFLKQPNEKDMRNLVMKIKAEDIYSINIGSIKDAKVLEANHTTGRNSSSPLIDANDNFIGLNYDRVW